MLYLHVRAPFAAFRLFSAGSFRPTASFLTPSAAYGLLLNIMGLEMRGSEGKNGATLIAKGLPPLKIAIGAFRFPERQELFQQLHNYPVGSTRKAWAPFTKGSKYNITPTTREFLSGIEAVIAVDGPETETMLRDGLKGASRREYGLPFLGDNSFLPDRLDEIAPEKAVAYWYCRIDGDTDLDSVVENQISRFTVTVDREDMTNTVTDLFAPLNVPTADIPRKAWVEVVY